MDYIKQHWFGIITGIVILGFLLLFVLVLLSPRQDIQKRGFIPCTEAMAAKMLDCQENKVSCMLGAIVANSWCDTKVIGQGMMTWAKGQQKFPWSNYIFVPESVGIDNDDEHLQEFYQSNPNLNQEMQNLKKLNEELENGTK